LALLSREQQPLALSKPPAAVSEFIMNYDELAFFNQQLAAMLREGIPLEGALKQLCADMKAGPLHNEMTMLEQDLAKGTPLSDAIKGRALPEFYTRMVAIGARSNDLPGVLTLLADYYQRANTTWNRLKGLMVYPALVLVISICFSIIVSLLADRFIDAAGTDWFQMPHATRFFIWIPPILMGCLLLAGLLVIKVPRWRARARWLLPAFREASLAQLASAITLMLKSGTPFPDALAFAATIESDSPAGNALDHWHGLIESGEGKVMLGPQSLRPLPPMFLWLVHKGGEDLTAGFQKAAEIYHSRASYKIELLLYGALPISILLLGQVVLWQVAPIFRTLVLLMNSLGAFGGDQ
jgi:type IV pilus assembly protein PilC